MNSKALEQRMIVPCLGRCLPCRNSWSHQAPATPAGSSMAPLALHDSDAHSLLKREPGSRCESTC